MKDDIDFYCPACVPETEEKFSKIKDKLKAKVDELAQRQIEFGGVTIDRDFFKDKKNANPHNYSQDFPPTLRDLGVRVCTRHKTMAHFKSDYKEMCKQLTEQLKEDFESRIQMVEWELDDIVEDVLKPEPDPVPDYEDLDPSDVTGDSSHQSVDASENSVEEGELNYGGLCENCDTRFSSPIIYKCIRSHKVCYPCRNLLSGCICPICYKTHGDRRKLTQDTTSAMMYRLANASNFDPSSLVPPKRRPRRPKKSPSLIKHAAEEAGGSLTPMIMNVWSCAEEASSTLVMDAPVTVKTEPEDPDPTQVSLAKVIPESDLSSNMLTLMNTDVLASSSTEPLNSRPLSSPDQQPVNYNDPEEEGSHSEESSQSQDQAPVKVRRISGEEWMQSLSGPSTKTPAETTKSKVWEQYKERAKLSGGVTKLGGGVTIQVNPATRTKIVKQFTRAGPVSPVSLHYSPDKGDHHYQPSDTDRYQTQSSHSYSHLLPTSPAPRPQLRNVLPLAASQHGLRQPHKTYIVRQTRPQQIIRPLRLVQPKQSVKKMIIVKNPGLQFYTDPLAASTSDASDAGSLVDTDEGQFITPDQIQESFNEIEKYLGAEDDNIFENVDGAQNETVEGSAHSTSNPS